MGILRTDRVSGLGGANAITGSAHFHGDHDGTAYVRYIDAGISDDFNFGTGDFTVECWINRTTLTNDDAIWATTAAEGSSSLFWYFNSSGQLRAYLGEGTSERTSSSNNIIAGRWYHIALTRASGTVNMWVDGVSKYSASSVTANVGSSTQNFIIGDGNTGYSGNAYMFLGHISNLRIQKGKAEYTATFTPPTTRLNVTPETVLLACHDPGNVLAEATGKTLTLIKSGTIGSNSAAIVASRFTPNSPVGFSTTTDVGTQFGTTFDGVTTFDSQAYMVPPGGNTRERNRGRALWAGGDNPGGPNSNVIDFIQIQSGGTGLDFGDLSVAGNQARGVSSFTRGVFGGGRRPSPATTNTMDFVTIANTANALDFGDLTDDRGAVGEISSSTRGIFAAGYNPSATNTIDFVTIATLGNASNFGDTTIAGNAMAGTQSTTRGILAGGYVPSTNVIQFLTIATTGDAQDFGDLTTSRHSASGTSNGVRAVFMGGDHASPAADNTIDFITIASTGNATDFGDLGSFSTGTGGATSDKIRGVFGTGWNGSNYLNVIQQVTIATTGNSVNIGELTLLRHQPACLGDAHGGLSE